MCEHSFIWRVGFLPYCIHSAVAEGPNHSPGYLPQHSAPCLTNRCIENGACGESANRESSRDSSSLLTPRRQSEWMSANNLWPWRWRAVGITATQEQNRQPICKKALSRPNHTAPSCVRREALRVHQLASQSHTQCHIRVRIVVLVSRYWVKVGSICHPKPRLKVRYECFWPSKGCLMVLHCDALRGVLCVARRFTGCGHRWP